MTGAGFDSWGMNMPRSKRHSQQLQQQQQQQSGFVMTDQSESWVPLPITGASYAAEYLSSGNGLPGGFYPSSAVSHRPCRNNGAGGHGPTTFYPSTTKREALSAPTDDENLSWAHNDSFSSSSASSTQTTWNNPFQGEQQQCSYYAGVASQLHSLPNLAPLSPHSSTNGGGGCVPFHSNPLLYDGSFSHSNGSDIIDMDMDIEDQLDQADDNVINSPCWSNDSRGANMPTPGMPIISLDSPPWSADPVSDEPTVSPKMLRINPSPTIAATASNESFQTTLLAGSESDAAGSAFNRINQQQTWTLASSSPSSHGPSSSSASKHKSSCRKQLPDKAPTSRLLAIFPSNGSSASSLYSKALEPTSKTSKPTKSNHSQSQGTLYTLNAAAGGAEYQNPRVIAQVPSPPSSTDSSVALAANALAERSIKDDFLIKSKLAGMTYKEIRTRGNFTEAESTLRGRFRTLTKNKEARVRKPEWKENDNRLLERAVRKLAKGDDLSSAKIPWKLVAQYIFDHGGSYHFGNTTCRKHWDELIEQGEV